MLSDVFAVMLNRATSSSWPKVPEKEMVPAKPDPAARKNRSAPESSLEIRGNTERDFPDLEARVA
jgi:hypothetical protein